MTDHHALIWYQAEHGDDAPPFSTLPDHLRAVIRERVRLVLEGEVRRSEASAGDLAVWHGRIGARPWATVREAREVLDAEYVDRLHVYDTCDKTDAKHVMLFGTKNIGNPLLSNMQVAGELMESVLIESWRVSVDGEAGVADRLLSKVLVHLVVGDTITAAIETARDLWTEPRSVGVLIPKRRYFFVELVSRGELVQLRELKLGIRVHLEGWIRRRRIG